MKVATALKKLKLVQNSDNFDCYLKFEACASAVVKVSRENIIFHPRPLDPYLDAL